MFNVFRIKSHEKGLLFRHGEFEKLLEPGFHWYWVGLMNLAGVKVAIVSTLETKFEHTLLDVLVRHDSVREALTVVELTDSERALVWKDGRLAYILGTGRHAFWNEPYSLDVEVFDTGKSRFEHEKMDAVLSHPGWTKWFVTVNVSEHEDTLLIKDGRIVEKLAPGRHVFWTHSGQWSTKAIDRREQLADIAGQEIMTRDKVTLRLNLLVTYRVADAMKAVSVVTNYAEALYRAAQLALRAAVGTRTLDALLADKDSISREVGDTVAERAVEFGVVVKSVGLKDIILPGEMKTILNQVIEAEKVAQANLIRRREETAAARSQANTAKLLADNPVLARMKELEMVQEILAGAKVSFMLGDKDLAGQLRRSLGGEEPTGE